MRSTTPMRIARTGSLVISALLFALGAALLASPGFPIGLLRALTGAGMIAFGCVRIAGYLSKDLYRLAFQYGLAFGLLMAALGLMVILEPDEVIDHIGIAVGIAALTDGLLSVQVSLDAKTFGIKRWWLILAVSVLSAAVGILLVFRTTESLRGLVIRIGIAEMTEALLTAVTVLSAVHIIDNQYPDLIKEDYVEEEK